MTVLYEKQDYLKVIFFKEKKYVMFKWHKFGIPLEDMKNAHQIALDTLLANNCYNYIAETSEAMGCLIDAVLNWWTNEWVPKLSQSGIKRIATVVPTSVLANYSTKDWQETSWGSIKLLNVKTIEEAEKFLETVS